MTTPRELLDVIGDFVEARSDTSDGAADRLQQIAQRFDVVLGELIIERASVQNEG
jgi:thiamine monophosphate kinase